MDDFLIKIAKAVRAGDLAAAEMALDIYGRDHLRDRARIEELIAKGRAEGDAINRRKVV